MVRNEIKHVSRYYTKLERLYLNITHTTFIFLKDFFFRIEVLYHTEMKLYVYMYIIMLIKQISNIEEYVKYLLQIFVHNICNHLNICTYFLLKKLTEIL
jgi:hypothetical protein